MKQRSKLRCLGPYVKFGEIEEERQPAKFAAISGVEKQNNHSLRHAIHRCGSLKFSAFSFFPVTWDNAAI